MSKVRIELNLAGVNELMKSGPIQEALQEAGETVAREAERIALSYAHGSGQTPDVKFGVRTHQAQWVAIANVYPDSRKAAKANYEDNVLLKGVGAAGLPTKKPRL